MNIYFTTGETKKKACLEKVFKYWISASLATLVLTGPIADYYFGLLQVRFHLRLVIFQLLFALQFSVLVLTQLIQFTHSLPIGTARYRLYFLLLFLLRNSRKPKTNSTYKWSFRSDMIKAGIYIFIKYMEFLVNPYPSDRKSVTLSSPVVKCIFMHYFGSHMHYMYMHAIRWLRYLMLPT
jgi:hypothetical protein